MTLFSGLQVIGLTRFTVDPASIINRQRRNLNIRYLKETLHKKIFANSNDQRSNIELRNLVYNPARLRQRLDLFETFPWQTAIQFSTQYKDFCYLIFYSSLISADLLSSLHELVKPYHSWCRLVEVTPAQSFFRVCQRELRALRTHQNVFSFRIDDDDALASDYLDHLIDSYSKRNTEQIFSLASGYYLSRVCEDAYLLESAYEPNIAIGLGRFIHGAQCLSIYDEECVHTLIPKDKVYYGTNLPSWIRTVHQTNDSETVISAKSSVVLDASNLRDALGVRFSHVSKTEQLRMMPIIPSSPSPSPKFKVLFGHQ